MNKEIKDIYRKLFDKGQFSGNKEWQSISIDVCLWIFNGARLYKMGNLSNSVSNRSGYFKIQLGVDFLDEHELKEEKDE